MDKKAYISPKMTLKELRYDIMDISDGISGYELTGGTTGEYDWGDNLIH